MSGLILSVGAICVIVGLVWLLWDRNATVPGWFFAIGVAWLIIGTIASARADTFMTTAPPIATINCLICENGRCIWVCGDLIPPTKHYAPGFSPEPPCDNNHGSDASCRYGARK
jgi:hypothetical protein